jgi:uncharacterized protein YlxP (DUF503 family)
MIVASMTVKLHAPWVHSLKEKRHGGEKPARQSTKSIQCVSSRSGRPSVHQIITIGLATVAANAAQVDSIFDSVLRFIEAHTEAEVISVEQERR